MQKYAYPLEIFHMKRTTLVNRTLTSVYIHCVEKRSSCPTSHFPLYYKEADFSDLRDHRKTFLCMRVLICTDDGMLLHQAPHVLYCQITRLLS